MARSKKKKRFTIHFELTIAGLFGTGIVCFCIFLWMFLLGIWAGQAILPTASLDDAFKSATAVTKLVKQGATGPLGREETPPIPAAGGKGRPAEESLSAGGAVEPELSEPSFFSIQVETTADEKKATQSAAALRTKGYEAFALPVDRTEGVSRTPGKAQERTVEDDKGGYNVYVGRFNELAGASKEAGKIEKNEKIKVYITLLPQSRVDKATKGQAGGDKPGRSANGGGRGGGKQP